MSAASFYERDIPRSVLESTLKFAVMTNNISLFNLIHQCFSEDRIECRRFDDDVALSRAIYREEYDAILVDAATGVDPTRAVFARRACYRDRRAPLIVVGAFAERNSIERAFDVGADDVVCAPIERSELMARTYLALRRFLTMPAAQSQPQSNDSATLGPYRLDRRTGTVSVAGQPVKLTVREFAIAWLLFSRNGEYVTRRQIAGTIWSSTEDIVGRTLEQHIYKLRKKLGLSGENGVQLRTMYAHGYRVEMCEPTHAKNDASAPAQAQPVQPLPNSEAGETSATTASIHSQAMPATEHAVAPQPACACGTTTDLSRANRPLEVHASDSKAARNAQPWDKHPALSPWIVGTPQGLKGKSVPNFVDPGTQALQGGVSVALNSTQHWHHG
jgi:DNA-binding response OmpR family regulator